MKSNPLAIILFCWSLMGAPFCIANEVYPSGFSDFFIERKKNVAVSLGDIRQAQTISALASYEQIRVEKDDEGYRQLRQFLTRYDVKSRIVDDILTDLTQGVGIDSECQGRLATCTLEMADHAKYVFDYDTSVLRIVLPIGALDRTISEHDFASPFSENYGLIHWMNLYASSDFEDHQYVTLSNSLIGGLPLGYINIDTQYSEQYDFELYQALYTAELEGNHRLQLGKNRYSVNFNATDYLSNHAELSGLSVYLASSRNLYKSSVSDYQRIDFFAPQAGQLEVYRGEQLLFNKIINQGAQHISYAELPKGTYQLTLSLKVSGNEILRETRQVVNNNTYFINPGEWDYALGLGRWDEESTLSNRDYYRALMTYRLDDRWFLSSGLTGTSSEQYYQAGAQYYWGDQGSLDYALGAFSQGGNFQYGRFSLSPLFIDYQQLDLPSGASELSQALYGSYSYRDIGLGVSGAFLGGNGYLRIGWYESEREASRVSVDTQQQLIYGGWSRSAFGGVFDISAQYSAQPGFDDNYSIMISWSMPLDDRYSVSSTIQVNDDGDIQNQNQLRLSQSGDNWSSYGAFGVTNNDTDQMSIDLTGSASGKSRWAKGSSYFYLNDKGDKTLSLGMSGTQAWGQQGVMFSPEKGQAFLHVAKSVTEVETEPMPLKSYISYSDRLAKRFSLVDQQVIPLTDYQTIQLKVDDSGFPIVLDESEFETFVYPGSVLYFSPSVTYLDSSLLILDNLEGKAILDAQCLGSGCINIEPVASDGVFRVSHLKGQPFNVVSKQGLCVFDKAPNDHAAKGYCLPGLEWLGKKETVTPQNTLDNLTLLNSRIGEWLFVGKFSRQQGLALLNRLKHQPDVFEYKMVGASLYLYVKNPQQLSQAQKETLAEYPLFVLDKEYSLDLSTLNSGLPYQEKEKRDENS
ncbi:TcfC E-set like domain-containing protein [Vibrio neptunius]|uniref:TcfC E-set like domain-containing protein n=1 Tax=Vibrio neptunius TaxID=170651 RepID=UPI0019CFC111|nr:TcfC E-set like domain-containing protein [Vibrio neptunius]MBN3571806.1 TcfC E-set like domain-containing protein [Vibrio neptunius]